MTGRFSDCECGHRNKQHAKGGGCVKCDCDGFVRAIQPGKADRDLRPANVKTKRRVRGIYGDRL